LPNFKVSLLIALALIGLALWWFEPAPAVFASGIVPPAYSTIQNGGSPLTQRQTVNMTFSAGAGSCSDSGGITVCNFTGTTSGTISGSGVTNRLAAFTGLNSIGDVGSLGTTTTVWHGNAAGLGSYGSVVNGDIANGTIDLTAKVTGVLPSANSQPHVISFSIDGGGSVIATGDAKIYPTADFSCTINRWDVSADQSGSITIDVWKAAGAIPTSGNKISASAPITLSTAQLAQNGSRTGWTSAVSVGDVFGFSVATVSTVTRVIGQVWCQ
jgi:hypothetical protein